MKTLILFEELNESFFFEFIGPDLSKYNNVYIGDVENQLELELSKIIYDDNGKFLLKSLNSPTKDWNSFIKCGILL